jgi:hypothetical protein
MSDKIDLGPTHMNLQPALHYSRKNLPKIKPFLFKSKKSSKKVKSIKMEKNRSSCAYNEGTNRCKYGSPHDAEKCVLNANGRCERHFVKPLEKVKSIKMEKNRSSCAYNEGTNRCKYGSPHDAEKCVLNANGRCERHFVKVVKANGSLRRSRCKNGTRRNQLGECVSK